MRWKETEWAGTLTLSIAIPPLFTCGMDQRHHRNLRSNLDFTSSIQYNVLYLLVTMAAFTVAT